MPSGFCETQYGFWAQVASPVEDGKNSETAVANHFNFGCCYYKQFLRGWILFLSNSHLELEAIVSPSFDIPLPNFKSTLKRRYYVPCCEYVHDISFTREI
jgi:hypothetical protein